MQQIRNRESGGCMRAAHVDCGDVHSVSFDNIHQVVRCGIRLPNRHIGVCYPIFAQNRLYLIVVDIREWHGVRNGNTTLVLPSNDDRWRFFVQSDPKAFKFGFDDFLVAEGFKYVQDNED